MVLWRQMNEETMQVKQNQPFALYHSYLLRLWCTEQPESECWRVSLEDSHTGELIGFANLEEFFAFLMAQVEVNSPLE
jgi:hypothetical protein